MLTLVIATQLGVFRPTLPEWKFISPCTSSQERALSDPFDRSAAAPKKSGRCKREDQLRRLYRLVISEDIDS
jgi:hypothetical protein